MKKKCLLIFKFPLFWNKYLINKLLRYYDTEYLYINNFKNKNFSEIVDEINEFIKSKNIEIVFFDVDFVKFINFFFIKKIINVKKILMTYDDYALHEMNAITANACDLVLSHCPFSVLKYKEKGYDAYCLNIESEIGLFKNHNLKKEIDVLFFGRINPDRKEILDFIANNGIAIKIVGQNNDFVTDEELSQLISKSRIVLNLSKSTGRTVINYASEDIYKFNYMWKGRIIISGLCGTLCISEYSPAQEIMFNKDEIPTFYTKEECVEILKNFLKDKELLSKYTNKFSSKIFNLYEDEGNFESIYNAIEKSNNRKVKLNKIPYWYLRIVAKQVIIRNIKPSNLIKTIFQFNEINKIIEKTNFYKKLLIIFESIMNILWYSFVSVFKSKK